jgi:membrane protease YdiL (CAAX protease family)
MIENMALDLTKIDKKDAHWWGLAAAYVLFGMTFRGPKKEFWNRMTTTGLTLGSIALLSEDDLRETKITANDFVMGIASAGVLYGVFVVGDRLARIIMPNGAEDIGSIYDLKTIGQKVEIGARLTFIIGPAEELFWRGLLQKRLIDKFGPIKGALLATAAYGSVHIPAGNPTLLGAATVAGAFWGGLHALGMPMGALIVSHAFWDVLTFLLAPIAKPLSEEKAALGEAQDDA